MSTAGGPLPDVQRLLVADSNGHTLFTVSWVSRESCVGRLSRDNCVAAGYVIEQYQDALRRHFETLTGNEVGFESWSHGSPLRVDVHDIRDQRGGRLWGLVEWDVDADSAEKRFLMRLSSRNAHSNPLLACQQRSATVLHELVHCFQFQSRFVRDWISTAMMGGTSAQRTGYRSVVSSFLDKFPLLIESTAYAMEAEYCGEIAEWHKWLWNWACYPERTLSADGSGIFGAPFLQFLIRSLGGRFAAELFRSPGSQLVGTTITELDAFSVLDFAVQRMPKPSAKHWGGVRDAFRDFCLRSALEIDPDGLFDARIFSAVGARMRSGIYDVSQPVAVEIGEGLRNAMSCRIFEFVIPAIALADRRLQLKLGCPGSCTDAGVAQVAADGKTLHMSWLPATTCGFEADINLVPNCSKVILTTVNGRFGRGNAVNAMGAISLSAELLPKRGRD
jgi:hypothetical protein